MDILFFLCICVGIYVLYVALHLWYKAYLSETLVSNAIPFSHHVQGAQKILIIGDSLAVGVGVTEPSLSLAGLIEKDLHFDITNKGVSGYKIRDSLNIARTLGNEHYFCIFFHIGGNNVLRGVSKKKTIREATELLTIAKAHADNVIWCMSGDIGHAAMFAWPLSTFFSFRSGAFNDSFKALAKSMNVSYVDLFEKAKCDLFLQKPKIYLSKDGLHPSDAGYALWYEKIKPSLN